MKGLEGYWKVVPKEPEANVRFRRWLLRRCRRDRKFRAAVRRMCRDDILFFINAFIFQFNPNAVGKWSREVGPFIAWEYQEEAVREILYCVENRKDLVIEKSREMGASWLCLIVMLWYILFHKYKKFLCVSKDADAVENASPDSLFWKIDHILEHLPVWLRGEMKRMKFYVGNEEKKSAITGVASTGDAGVSGRATAIFVDEYSLMRHDFMLLRRTANTTGCRIFNGTHRGTGTALAELTNPDSASSAFVRKLQLHWSRHPDKVVGAYRWDAENQCVKPVDPSYAYPADFKFVTDALPAGGPFPGLRSPWYDDMCGRIGSSRGVAMELDIDPVGSKEQLFSPAMIRDLIERYARVPDWEGDLVLREDGQTLLWNERAGGACRLWLRLDKENRPESAAYVFGVDPAQGTGATPSCVAGLNGYTGEKVFSYVDPNIEPTGLAHLMVAVCNWFKDYDGAGAHLIWELQGPGAIFKKRIMESGYRRVYCRRDETKFGGGKASDSPGWNAESKAKDNLLMSYRDGLRGGLEGRFLNHCKAALMECLSFNFRADGHIEHSGEASPNDLSGARINHGDMVIADALAWKYAVELRKLARPGAVVRTQEIPKGSLAWRRLFVQNVTNPLIGGRKPWAS